MGKKPNKAKRAPRQSSAQPAVSWWEGMLRQPTLVCAWLALGFTIFAAGAALHFRDQLDMGAIREPTGLILWGGITVTLFASHYRQRRRTQKTDL